MIWFGLVLWHINYYRLFNAKSSLYIYNFHHRTCESMCDTLSSSAANQGDNTVSVDFLAYQPL